jgi:glycosyltransferase involved in cell wall biosynthesis
VRVACLAASQVPSRTANSIQVMKVAQALADLGHEVQLELPGPDPGASPEDLKERYGLRTAVPVHWLPSLPFARRYDFAFHAVRAARNWRADLVYAWPLPAAAFSAWLGMPTLLEMHDVPSGLLGRRWFGAFLGARGARRLVVISRALLGRLREDFPRWQAAPEADVQPMGVDLDRYEGLPDPPEARRRLGLDERITASYTGHLYAGRGMDLLFELARRHPEVQFLWIGGEEAAIDRWRRRQEEAHQDNLRVVGFRNLAELPLYHAASDVLLMPYERHVAGSSGGDTAAFASPMKMFEYLAAGRAILSSDLPVLREILHEGIARLIPPMDVGAWSRALRALAEDRSARLALGHAARQEAAHYSWTERTRRVLAGLP